MRTDLYREVMPAARNWFAVFGDRERCDYAPIIAWARTDPADRAILAPVVWTRDGAVAISAKEGVIAEDGRAFLGVRHPCDAIDWEERRRAVFGDPPPPFGERIRAARKALGMTQVQLASAAGVDQTTLSKLERTLESRGEPETIAKVLHALGMKPEGG